MYVEMVSNENEAVVDYFSTPAINHRQFLPHRDYEKVYYCTNLQEGK
jgi:hypothetical protein